MIRKWAEDIPGVVVLLAGMVIFFAIMLMFAEWRFNNDSVVFQAFSSILSGFVGALVGIITGGKLNPAPPHPPTPPANPQ